MPTPAVRERDRGHRGGAHASVREELAEADAFNDIGRAERARGEHGGRLVGRDHGLLAVARRGNGTGPPAGNVIGSQLPPAWQFYERTRALREEAA